jgi:MFS family permease
MLGVMRASWALLFGMFLLQIGNGLQGSLMGVRGAIEGFSTFEISLIASAYFVGFLGGSRVAPKIIARVGHVRVFAALGSLISAVLVTYPLIADHFAWIALRILIGFALSGVYVTAESWLNNAATNDTRGQALSAYSLVQMIGIVMAQAILSSGDPAGYVLFIIPSILVSISFAPILLSATPTPAFAASRPMSLGQLYRASPFGVVGMTLLGSVFAGQYAMAAVYATEAGLGLGQLSAFISSFFVGAIILQYPLGWLSDRMDRRLLIVIAAALGCVVGLGGLVFGVEDFTLLLAVGTLSGGLAQPLYAMLIAYTNDYLEIEDMAAASGGLVFVNGVGAIAGPPIMGILMARMGPGGFWLFLSVVLALVTAYGLWRMTQRQTAFGSDEPYEAVSYANLLPGSASVVAVETAQELYAEAAEEQAEAAEAAEEAEAEAARTSAT